MKAAPCCLLWTSHLQFEKKQSYPHHTNTPHPEMLLIAVKVLEWKAIPGGLMSPEHQTPKTSWRAPCGGNWKGRCPRLLPSPGLINKLDACKSWDVYCLHESTHADSLGTPRQCGGFWILSPFASGHQKSSSLWFSFSIFLFLTSVLLV